MLAGSDKPATSEAFTVAPVVASYSPIVPLSKLVTYKSAPDRAMPYGSLNPETSDMFTVAPVIALSSVIVPFM